jgi:CBS domain-containing protein
MSFANGLVMRAGELGIRTMVTAFRDDTVVDAARRMADHESGDLIVVAPRGAAARPIGTVTDRDLVKLLTHDDAVRPRTVADVMRDQIITASVDDEIEGVLASLRLHRLRQLPLVDRHGVLQGIITLDAIADWMAEQLRVTVGLVERPGGDGVRLW